jgi:transposase
MATSRKIDRAAADAMLAGGMTPHEVAERFGVTPSAIYLMRRRARLEAPASPLEASMARLIESAGRLDAEAARLRS